MLNTELINLLIKSEKKIKLSLKELSKLIESVSINKNNIDKVIDELYRLLEEKIYNIFIYVYDNGNLETHYLIQKIFKVEYNVNQIKTEEILKKIKGYFLRSNISKRLHWQKQKLKHTIKESLKDYPVKSKEEAYKLIRKRLQVAQYDLRRLMTTEGNRVANNSILQAIKDNDFIQQVIFMATLDNRTSKICRSMDGKIFNKNELVLGVNLPPLHPFCRSVIGVYEDGLLKDRIERNIKTGKSTRLGKYLTFDEWKRKNNLY